MARRLIGLDIGTNAITVAEVTPGAVPRLERFGQVALARDAMHEGEIADDLAVTEAIARLCAEVDLKKASVRVGLASPRVIVRQVEMPIMSADELAAALRFQATDLIPIPIDEAVLDFAILGNETAEDGEPVMRVLLAAAQQVMVARLVAAVENSGLSVASVDLVPLALIRGLAPANAAEDREGAEGIVSFGGGVTAIAVHENGVPKFVRVLGTAGRELTDAIATELGIEPDAAEAVKRQLGTSGDELVVRARQAIERPLATLLDEVRSSLDYYRNQPGAGRLAKVVVTGGGSQLPGMGERLSSLVGVPVEAASPRAVISVGDIGFANEDLVRLDPYLPAAVGLALGGAGVGTVIDLLPRARRSRGGATANKSRRVAGGVAAAAALLFLLGGATMLQRNELNSQKDKLAATEAENDELQEAIDELAPIAEQQMQVEAIDAQMSTLLASDVSWARMLREIGNTIPQGVWLKSFQAESTSNVPVNATPALPSGSASPASSTSAPATPSTINGLVTVEAIGVDYPDVSNWLRTMGDPTVFPSFANVWVSSATEATFEEAPVVNFSTSAQLTDEARSDRLEKYQEGSAKVKSRGMVVGALAAGFVVIFWYMVVYSGVKKDVSSAKSQVSAAQQENDELASEKHELESLEDQGPAIEAKLQALQTAVPVQPELAKFIDEVDALGAQAGIDWVSVAPTEPMSTNGVGTIQMTIQVNGDYFKVIDYLGKIEGMSRLVVIDTINLTEATGDGSGAEAGGFTGPDGPKLSVTLTARMFTQAVPSTAPVPVAAPPADAANTNGTTTPTTSATTNVAEG